MRLFDQGGSLMNDQAKRITGLTIGAAFAAALGIVGGLKARLPRRSPRSASGSPRRARMTARRGKARAVPAPPSSIIKAMPGSSCRTEPASPWSSPMGARAAWSRSIATCRLP